MIDIDIRPLEKWIGRQTVLEDEIALGTARLMAATLDRKTAFQHGDPLPLGWHWLYFHEPVQTSALGQDGHAKRGDETAQNEFMPPIPLPHRMWAGGHLNFLHPLHLGDQALKRSSIKAITPKQGRSGPLCFITVTHEISVADTPCLREEQTIVYRQATQAKSGPIMIPALTQAQFSSTYTPTPMALFRYSALTFNSHRIHYDLAYCREVEGYPDLVVHGPLIATLLLDLWAGQFPETRISTCTYRARSPLFNPHRFTLKGQRTGERGQAWAVNHAGGLAMEADLLLQR